MGKVSISIIVYVAAVFVASCSQILLKVSAGKKYSNRIKEYLNVYVIGAYSLFVLTTFATIWALRIIPISVGSALETLGYIFVAILSSVFLKEKISKNALLGYVLIVVGVTLFQVAG